MKQWVLLVLRQRARTINRFIFDVDGTLTPSRCEMDPAFQKWFVEFQKQNAVYLVTGSDRAKTIEQVGEKVYNLSQRVYKCSGSDTWEQDKNTFTSEWQLPERETEFLTEKLTQSTFPLRTGIHFEHRPGMCNFSVVGRGATKKERQHYIEFDQVNNERNQIATSFCKRFPNIEAKVGGETGIDLFPQGSNKSQILRDFDSNDCLHFFGDAMHPEGNDYPLKQIIVDKDLGFGYTIENYKETWEILRDTDWSPKLL